MNRILPILPALALSLAASAQTLQVPGKPAVAAKAVQGLEQALRMEPMLAGLATEIRLAVPHPAALEAPGDERDTDKRARIGVHRDVARETESLAGPSKLYWKALAGGGFAARVSVVSPQAASLRLGLEVRALPAGAQFRFGSGTSMAVDAVASGEEALAATRQHGAYWSPLTDGDTQVVEIRLPPGSDPSAVRVRVDSASHLGSSPSGLFKAVTGVGAAQACNQDVICASPGNAAVAQAARSVAKLVYTENGSTYLCSGTLVNDGSADSQVPYLYTAAHCIGTQAAAASLNTFWFFEAASCGSKGASAYRQLSSGATLLYASTSTDASLLRLNDRAPDGAWFSGWDATPLASGSPLVALHHPAGDLKKLSTGQALDPTASSGASYSTVAWSTGSTEGGSSGSGIFTLQGDQYLLRGGLRGGSASCDTTGRIADPSNRDYYSRLDLEAAALRTWLSASAAPLEDYTDLWWDPAEPGWGISIMQAPTNKVFATWYTYDASGAPTWLAMPEGSWKSVSALEGALYRTAGTSYAKAYEASRFAMNAVGSGRIDFAQDGTATLTLTVDGMRIVKPIQRLR